MKYADRLSTIEPFYVVDVLTRAKLLEKQGVDVVQMAAGEPDFSTIQPIVDAAKSALDEGKTYYTEALGLLPLREKISEFYQDRYGVHVSPRRILITPGASGALQLTALTLLNPSDGVLLADPGYPSNRQFIRLAGGEAQLVPVGFENNYQLTGDLVKTHWQTNTKVAQVATPSNPTGSVLSLDELAALHAQVSQNRGHLVVDELYHGLDFEEPCQSVLSLTDSAFVINSFSKYFGMTGWRL
ncbi:MAG: aminotransferase class I/II-fold pyridoxal phosphate-dependent enzyme, partial [Cellvibrionales bacterium]|nr:aminotransferase class I/II-fold pyridoxal phosphate-dependent enzyme [Cellvibrionales bacterium]